MIDAAVRLFSLFNQLALCSRRVLLDPEEGIHSVMDYLNRAGLLARGGVFVL
jgi:hypothetical protein